MFKASFNIIGSSMLIKLWIKKILSIQHSVMASLYQKISSSISESLFRYYRGFFSLVVCKMPMNFEELNLMWIFLWSINFFHGLLFRSTRSSNTYIYLQYQNKNIFIRLLWQFCILMNIIGDWWPDFTIEFAFKTI